jgi:PAS domain S-box-containing protein
MSDEPARRPPRRPDAECARQPVELLGDAAFTQSLLANISESITVLDLDGRIAFMSAAALRAMAIDDEDTALATSWLVLWHDDTERATAAVAAARAGLTGSFEGIRLATDGTTGWWEVTVSPILGADGRPARLLAIARDVTARKLAQQSHQQQRHEMHHQMKNMLAMVMGVTAQTLARAPSVAEGRAAVERRLMALAEAHNVVHEDAGGTSLHRIVECAVASCHPAHIAVHGPDIRLSSRAAMAVAMAFHELSSNAIKYGALSVETGRAAIAWRIDAAEPRLHLTWRERGGPTVRKPDSRGFGSRVIEMSFRHQLDGSAKATFDPSGVVWSFDVPLAALQDQRL